MTILATQVRMLTGLAVDELTDAEIFDWLDLNDGQPRLAAADALETYAGQLITAVQSDDISLDGSKRAGVLMARAARLRQQIADAAADSGFFFEVVDTPQARAELTERSGW